MLYWVLMNLVTHAAMNIEAKVEEMVEKKEGDSKPSKALKEQNKECRTMGKKIESLSVDCKLMHLKVDQIASHVGISLYSPDLEQRANGGLNRRVEGRHKDCVSIMPPTEGEPFSAAYGVPTTALASGGVPCLSFLWVSVFRLYLLC